MRWRARATADAAPTDLFRRFITPEGVALRLELGSAGTRMMAFLIDLTIQFAVLIGLTIAAIWLLGASRSSRTGLFATICLLGFFLRRNGWFPLFEASGRAATPGKRMLGLRVIARDGGRLTVPAVTARNAMREIEVFLPLTFLLGSGSRGRGDALATLAALLWSGILLLFPLFNRDRLRAGDLIAGTWVVRTTRMRLAADLISAERGRRAFSDAALDMYGAYELQMLADVLRQGESDAITSVAATIRRKAGLPDDRDDLGFLTDYYAALGGRLERRLLFGERRKDKHDPSVMAKPG